MTKSIVSRAKTSCFLGTIFESQNIVFFTEEVTYHRVFFFSNYTSLETHRLPTKFKYAPATAGGYTKISVRQPLFVWRPGGRGHSLAIIGRA